MANGKNGLYFKIGLFILIGIALIVGGIVFLASKNLWQKTITMETYFSESVQGLSKGSPVKFLGMDIGEVTDIATVSNIYYDQIKTDIEKSNRYIYVKMAINPRFFNAEYVNNIDKEIKNDIYNGLRVKLALQGLTGNAYLEFAYADVSIHPTISIFWTPENYYIPSIPSTLAYFSENVSYLLRELRKVDFKQLFDSFQNLMDVYDEAGISLSKFLEDTRQQTGDLIPNLTSASRNVQQLTEQVKENPSSVIFGKPPQKLDLNKL